MDIVRTGVILNTERYDECVSFYQTVFGLDVLYQELDGNDRLTCFSFGGAYLMIETGGFACGRGKTAQDSAAKLRINVSDIEGALDELRSRGIAAEVRRSPWGSTIDLHDPDGNRVSIRDEPTFLAQLGR